MCKHTMVKINVNDKTKKYAFISDLKPIANKNHESIGFKLISTWET